MYKIRSDNRKLIYELNGKLCELPCRWLKIYEDGVLIRHFEACINKDNQIGYYEYVLEKFFLPEKPIKEVGMSDVHKDYFSKDGVTYIDYNTQYIDTGIKPYQTSLFDEIMNKNDFIGKCRSQNTVNTGSNDG